MKTITKEELTNILKAHTVWLNSDSKEGERANLSKTDLVEANLVEANLVGANLVGADLSRANLVGANLERANLERANLERANLVGANLERANLERANLERAHLAGAYLVGANLERANLVGAHLSGTILEERKKTKNDLLKQAEQEVQFAQKFNQLRAQLENPKNSDEHLPQTQKELDQLEEELKTTEDIEKKYKELQAKFTEGQENALKDVIKYIKGSTDKTDKMLTSYNRQSIFFMSAGVMLYLLALGVAICIYKHIDFNEPIKNWSIFAPTFLLSFLGTALLRHDWKIRELAGDLIAQQNTTDTATGILNASLTLKSIDDIPSSILEDSFNDVRSALLLGKKAKHDKKDEPIIDPNLIKALK